MRSIRASFLEVRNNSPYWSDFICLASAIQDRDFSRERIRISFNKLVDKNDYYIKSKRRLITHLVNLSKSSPRHRCTETDFKSKALKIQS